MDKMAHYSKIRALENSYGDGKNVKPVSENLFQVNYGLLDRFLNIVKGQFNTIGNGE